MPHIIDVGTAVPDFKVSQNEVRQFAGRIFRKASFEVDRLLRVFQNTRISERHFCFGGDWFETDKTFPEKNKVYLEHGIQLAERAVRDALARTNLSADQIGHIFFISSTGISTPSIDAHLFNRVSLNPSILRTPIWGLGCAGGVAGIIRAADWLRTYPDRLALVVALELCGLTFIRGDLSKSNFIASSLFADGCGAVLMAGDSFKGKWARRISVESSSSVTWPDTLDIMGWKIVEKGLKVVFSRSIPAVVASAARPAILDFLHRHDLGPADIAHFLAHPGGQKVIEAYRDALGIEEDKLDSMKQVLGKFGNMSSATVCFVLRHFLDSNRFRPGDLILSTALGPGFSSEAFLGRCENGG
ncbi:MAG: type III polyketide synthase [Syntrophobacteraceae bacterium]